MYHNILVILWVATRVKIDDELCISCSGTGCDRGWQVRTSVYIGWSADQHGERCSDGRIRSPCRWRSPQQQPTIALSVSHAVCHGRLEMQQMHMGFQGVQATLGVLQATTAVIGVGTFAGVALSAVNLHQTLKLKKAVERLEVKVENGFINLEQLLKGQGAEIKQLISEVVADIKFENHRLVLVRAYGLFNQAIQRMRSALQLQDINRRNAEIDAARGMLFEALADYKNPHLLEETCAAGQLRRLECSWGIEQIIIGTYQVQNEFGAAGDRLSQLQQQIRQDGLTVIAGCDSDEELDFLFPEITRIHNHDLAALDTWQNQIEWMKALPPSELKQLQSADFSKSNSAIIGEQKSATTALGVPDEQLFYENLRAKSHFYALRTQLELMLDSAAA